MARYWDRWSEVAQPIDLCVVLRQACHDLSEVEVGLVCGERPPADELLGLLRDLRGVLACSSGTIRALLREVRP